MRKKYLAVHEGSTWWTFIPTWNQNIKKWVKDFCEGKHQFSPMRQYEFKDGMARSWSYLDRLMMRFIYQTIYPTFKHIISPLCKHLRGPSVIQEVTRQIKEALSTNRFHYIMRVDIQSFYASIDHKILLSQLKKHFDNPILRKYLEDIVTIPIDHDGNIFLPTQGIPRQSPLSPFFGALYLSDLDKAFTDRKGFFYCRYMDDIILLIETKRQYVKARKILFQILRDLRLQVSPRKTRMGVLKTGFHFLGVNFEVSQNPQGKNQETKVGVHNRSCRRALDHVIALRNDAVHPANIQRYLIRWASWWLKTVTGLNRHSLLDQWIFCTKAVRPDVVWLGSGLLLGLPPMLT